MSWRFKGTPVYLDIQGDRLGLSKVLTHRGRTNSEIHRVSVLLGQMCERYHRLGRTADGELMIQPGERAQVAATLGQADEESAKLHALAAAAQAMIDEAYAAYGIEPPVRHHRVGCDFDDLPSPADLIPIRRVRESAKAKAAAAK